MTSPKNKFVQGINFLLWMAGLGVLAVNIFLVRQNRQLLEAAAPEITAGAQLQMLSGLNLEGRWQPVSLPPAGSKLLIVTFSPGCPACQANLEGWTKLASALEPKGVRLLWVSRDPIDVTRDYCTRHGISLSDTVADPPHGTYVQLGLARVPNTLLVGASGTVE
ncbi:MAG TPA: redoxin domain-containing protein, partial [Terriglobia bacterium]|nr:redoxin domain-containing protein [Terriglobia bacterium]